MFIIAVVLVVCVVKRLDDLYPYDFNIVLVLEFPPTDIFPEHEK